MENPEHKEKNSSESAEYPLVNKFKNFKFQ